MRILKRWLKDQAGLSLVELMVAISLIAIVSGPIIGMLNSGSFNNVRGRHLSTASSIAQAKIEESRYAGYDVAQSEARAPVPGSAVYEMQVEVVESEWNLKRVTVIVFWEDSKGEHWVGMRTYLTGKQE